MSWRGFVKESKSYMNYPDNWTEWKAQLYLANGEPDPDYPGWTMKDKRTAKLKFWWKFPRAWFRFYGSWFYDYLKCIWRRVSSLLFRAKK